MARRSLFWKLNRPFLVDERELAPLESAEREQALKFVNRRLSQSWRWLVFLLVPCLLALALEAYSGDWIRERLGAATGKRMGALLADFIPVGFTLLILLLAYRFFRSSNHLELRQYLNLKGIRVCLRCGYDLRATTEPRCPECGAPPARAPDGRPPP